MPIRLSRSYQSKNTGKHDGREVRDRSIDGSLQFSRSVFDAQLAIRFRQSLKLGDSIFFCAQWIISNARKTEIVSLQEMYVLQTTACFLTWGIQTPTAAGQSAEMTAIWVNEARFPIPPCVCFGD